MSRVFWVLIALVLLGAACGSSPRDDAIQVLQDEGVSQSAAECMLDDFEAAGLSPSELASGDLSVAGEDLLLESLSECASPEDLTNVVGGAGADELRQSFIDGFVASGLVDDEQAECVMAELEALGVSVEDLSRAAIEGDEGAFQTQVVEATATCVGG